MITQEQARQLVDVGGWTNYVCVIDRLFFEEKKSIDDIVDYLKVCDDELGTVYKMIGVATAIRLKRVDSDTL